MGAVQAASTILFHRPKQNTQGGQGYYGKRLWVWSKVRDFLGLNEKPSLVSHTPGHMNMNLGSRTGDFAKTSLGKSGGKQSLSWINESSMESYLLL
jgi:hypothetical protein